MDLRFRDIDNQPPAAAPSSSRCSSSSDPSLREIVERRVKEEMRIREMAWRRKVEMEIRREIILEQEQAILRAAGRTSDEQFSMKSWEGRMQLNQSNSSPLRFLEATDDDQKDKLILLPKPDPQQFEPKRKAMRPATEAEAEAADTAPEPPFGWILNKAKKEEEKLFCKRCKISTTSQSNFDAHLRGKKHRANSEANGRLELAGKVLEKTATTMEEEEGKQLEEQPDPDQNKGFYKFWCKICQIGTQNIVVMENHNMGKKHKARLLKLSWEQHKISQIPWPN